MIHFSTLFLVVRIPLLPLSRVVIFTTGNFYEDRFFSILGFFFYHCVKMCTIEQFFIYLWCCLYRVMKFFLDFQHTSSPVTFPTLTTFLPINLILPFNIVVDTFLHRVLCTPYDSIDQLQTLSTHVYLKHIMIHPVNPRKKIPSQRHKTPDLECSRVFSVIQINQELYS